MSSDDRIRNRSAFKKPLLILGVFMTAFYIILGSLLLLSKEFVPGFVSEFRNIFATMLIIYGIYRGWRVYADNFQ